MSHPLLSDPFVVAQIDDAVLPFVGRLPDEDVAWMREQLALWLEQDSEANGTLRAAHPRNVDTSGERVAPLGDARHEDEAAAVNRRRS